MVNTDSNRNQKQHRSAWHIASTTITTILVKYAKHFMGRTLHL